MLRRRASDSQPEPPARPPARASICQSLSGSLRGPAGPSHGASTAGLGEGSWAGRVAAFNVDPSWRAMTRMQTVFQPRSKQLGRTGSLTPANSREGQTYGPFPGKGRGKCVGRLTAGRNHSAQERRWQPYVQRTSGHLEAVLRFTVLRFPIFRVLSGHGAMIGGASGQLSGRCGRHPALRATCVFAVTMLAPRS
jgi:hypothetical protein